MLDPLILAFLAVGFGAQLIDGILGMGYGVVSTTFLLGMGIPPALTSASVHTAEIFTTAAPDHRLGQCRRVLCHSRAMDRVLSGDSGTSLENHLGADSWRGMRSALGGVFLRKAAGAHVDECGWGADYSSESENDLSGALADSVAGAVVR